MIKEIHRAIYAAIGRKDIPLMASDLLEPKSRPGLKIYIKPTPHRMNENVRITDYDIMVIYYTSDMYKHYIETYEMEEAFEELLLGCVELENGIFIEFDDLEFKDEGDALIVYLHTSIDTYVDTEADDEVMEELGMVFEI